MNWRAIVCFCVGHKDEVQRGRLVLRCLNCGRETDGWRLDLKPPRVIHAESDGRERQPPRRLRRVS